MARRIGVAQTTPTQTSAGGIWELNEIANAVNVALWATHPGAPTIGTATAGNAQATVPFTAPASNGGYTITTYTATSNPGNITGTASSSPITVTGLTNGTAYTFAVTATNILGTGAASAASNSVTPTADFDVDYLIVGGGGGGAAYASGGGAGGYVESTFTASAITNYAVTIGAGGTKGGDDDLPTDFNILPTSGNNSSVFSKTALGGGAAGSQNVAAPVEGEDGGSGGGGGRGSLAGGSGLQPTETPSIGFGNDGGTYTLNNTQGCGGGGAGGSATGTNSEIGGIGKQSSITGTSVYYAGGGGGSGYPGGDIAGAGGAGGGGDAGAISSTDLNVGENGTANLGGGGGGGNLRSVPSNQAAYGGNGGSGVVILKYPDSVSISNPGGGLTFTTSTAVSGYKITTITAGTGNVSWS